MFRIKTSPVHIHKISGWRFFVVTDGLINIYAFTVALFYDHIRLGYYLFLKRNR